MAYVNDAQTLADVVSPIEAANQLQTQNAQANVEQQIKNQVAAGQAPADIAKPGLMNQLTQAQTTAEQGLGMQQQAKGLVDMFAAPSGAQATVAGNQAKMTADQASKLGSLGQISGQIAGYLDNVPAPARPAAMAQILQNQGVDPGSVGPLASGDPDMLRKFSANAIQTSQSYQVENLKSQTQQNVAQTEAGSREQVAQTLGQSRQAVAQTNAEVKRQLAPLQSIIGQLTAKAANGTATPQEQAILQWAQQSNQLIRSGDPFQAGITGTNVQSNVPNVPNVPGQQAPGQQPPAAPDQNAIEAEMRRRGLLK
jgi:hypothetical protein